MKNLKWVLVIVMVLTLAVLWVSYGALASIPGDANEDGQVSVGDITKVERIILTLDLPTPGADANLNGEVNMGDATKILRIIFELD